MDPADDMRDDKITLNLKSGEDADTLPHFSTGVKPFPLEFQKAGDGGFVFSDSPDIPADAGDLGI